MKKGLRKLILSGTALAAVAATLGTSTYAWYTANETVSATNINGASAGATDASIFISKDTLAWSSTVEMENTDILGEDLLPVEYVGNTTVNDVTSANFKLLNTTNNAVANVGYNPASPAITSQTFKTDGTLFTRTGDTEAEYVYTPVLSGDFDSGTPYYTSTATYTPSASTFDITSGAAKKFTLYFRTSAIAADNAAPTVYLKNIVLRNTTPAYNAVDEHNDPVDGRYNRADNLYYTQTNGYGVNPNQATYGVDFTQALKMVIVSDAPTAGINDEDDDSYVAQNVNTKSLDLVAYQQTTHNGNLSGTADALSYYNNIMGTNLTYGMNTRQNQSVIAAKNNSSTRQEISLGTLRRDAAYITVDFYIYLDGWDTYCYDACKGQTFQLDLEFTSDADEALTYAGTTKA